MAAIEHHPRHVQRQRRQRGAQPGGKVVANALVGIEAQHPFGGDAALFKREAELARVVDPGMLHHSRAQAAGDLDGAVGGERVDH